MDEEGLQNLGSKTMGVKLEIEREMVKMVRKMRVSVAKGGIGDEFAAEDAAS